MWKYIITWCLINYIPIECDINKPYKDEFGRTIQHSYSIYCEKIEYDCGHKLEIYERDSAFIFYEKGKKESMYSMNTIDSVKIDSIWINNKWKN